MNDLCHKVFICDSTLAQAYKRFMWKRKTTIENTVEHSSAGREILTVPEEST